MRSKATGLFLILLVLLAGIDITEHNFLKGAVDTFMAEGDRNTADDGFERDIKLAELDARLSNVEAICVVADGSTVE